MIFKRIIGIILILAGIGMIGTSYYIMNQVEQGKIQVADAQQKVDTGSTLFSLSPATKGIGKEITDSAGKKINAANEEIAQYEDLADKLKMGGIAAIILGFGVVFIGKRRKK